VGKRLVLGVACGVLLALGAAGAGAASDPGAWLDAAPAGWNAAGAALPTAPPAPSIGPLPCARDERAAAGPEEAQLAAAGWKLESYWPTQRAGDAALVTALAGYDGMCRPWQFDGFVFVGDRFVGTLAPAPMSSREDGVLVGTPRLSADGAVEAEFTRYAPTDPLCCPSRGRTRVDYAVANGALAPVRFTPVPPAAIGGRPAPAPTQLPRTGGPAPVVALAAGALMVAAGRLVRSGR